MRVILLSPQSCPKCTACPIRDLRCFYHCEACPLIDQRRQCRRWLPYHPFWKDLYADVQFMILRKKFKKRTKIGLFLGLLLMASARQTCSQMDQRRGGAFRRRASTGRRHVGTGWVILHRMPFHHPVSFPFAFPSFANSAVNFADILLLRALAKMVDILNYVNLAPVHLIL
jgi:hypothetical protein